MRGPDPAEALKRPVRASLRAARWVGTRPHYGRERGRLEPFRNLHRGERCFVFGNGPSLRGCDLGPLAAETTFVTNHFYFHPQIEALRPTYYCVSDLYFFDRGLNPDWAANLNRFPDSTTFFLPIELRRRVRTRLDRAPARIHYLRCDRHREIWSLEDMTVDVTGVLHTGDSVVLDFCLPLAHFMGFASVYLLGCDTDYGAGETAHFYEERTPSRSTDYHRDRWVGHVTRSYAIARGLFEQDDRQIYNATAGGQLEVFPRVRLADVLTGSNRQDR